MNTSSKNIAILLIPLTLFASTVADEVGANESKRKLCLETPLVGKTIRELLSMDCKDIWKKSYESNFVRYEKVYLESKFSSPEKVTFPQNWYVDVYSDDTKLIISSFVTKDFEKFKDKSIKMNASALAAERAIKCVEENPRKSIVYFSKGPPSYVPNPLYIYCKKIHPYLIELAKREGYKDKWGRIGMTAEEETRPQFSNLDQIKSDKKNKVADPNKANNICMKAKDYEGCMKYQGTK